MERENILRISLELTRRQALFILTALLICWKPGPLGSETLTITTYYPAPYGAYSSLLTTDQTLLARDAGNVGVGTPFPTAKLQIMGENGSNDKQALYAGGAGGIGLVVTNAGNVGIGVPSPSARLHIAGTIKFSGGPPGPAALCINAAGVLSRCVSAVDALGACTCM